MSRYDVELFSFSFSYKYELLFPFIYFYFQNSVYYVHAEESDQCTVRRKST